MGRVPPSRDADTHPNPKGTTTMIENTKNMGSTKGRATDELRDYTNRMFADEENPINIEVD